MDVGTTSYDKGINDVHEPTQTRGRPTELIHFSYTKSTVHCIDTGEMSHNPITHSGPFNVLFVHQLKNPNDRMLPGQAAF